MHKSARWVTLNPYISRSPYYSRFQHSVSRKWCMIELYLQWQTDRKSYMICLMVPFKILTVRVPTLAGGEINRSRSTAVKVWSRRNLVKLFDADNTGMIGLPYGEKNCGDMLNRFHLIPERHGRTNRQTDRQTDRFAIGYQYRTSVCRRAIKTGRYYMIFWHNLIKRSLFYSILFYFS